MATPRVDTDDATALRPQDGRVRVEDVDARELAERFGTPLFVVSDARLRANYRRIRDAFLQHWPGELNVMYAIKANFALAIRRVLAQEGAGGDAFGLGELQATLGCGTDPARTSLGGSGKTPEAIETAVRAGVRITVDALDELPVIAAAAADADRPAVVSLRAKPVMPELNAFRSVASPYREGREVPLGDWVLENKWGLTADEAAEAVAVARDLGDIELRGVHSHVGRHYGYTAQYGAMIPGLVAWVAELRDRTGFAPTAIDIGGGWAHPGDPVLRGPASAAEAGGHPELWDDPRGTIEELAAVVCGALRERLDAAGLEVETLELEPGRFIVSDAALLLGRVVSVKDQPGIATYVNVDASVAHFPLPELADSANRVVIADRADQPLVDGCAIVGPSCYEDLLGWGRALPAAKAGDVLAFFDAGACADAYAANTNAIPRPAVVMVRGSECAVVRRRETIGDVFARDALPPWSWSS
jgi:diaminopimelate decarboxylase